MSKIIIENRTELPDVLALDHVKKVIELGRISKIAGKYQYCFYTRFHDGYSVSAFLNKKSDRFVVWDESGSVQNEKL